ncbi:MAG: hypothetical protein U0797_00450 [Gemmataceae bacterium]
MEIRLDALLGLLVIVWVMFGALAAFIAEQKRAGVTGFIIGFLFGPLGVVVACFLDARPPCPECGGPIPVREDFRPSTCMHCRAGLRWEDEKPVARSGEAGSGTPQPAPVAPKQQSELFGEFVRSE